MDAFSGIVLLDKPAGITSFQALFPLKRIFHTRRVGHAGSLDMRASGLIVAAVGRATRLLSYVEAAQKSYSFRLHLGYETATLEWDGELTEQDSREVSFSLAEVEAVLSKFRGLIQQVPPNYSAIKIKGHRASDLMLRGREFEIPARAVTIDRLEIKGLATTPTENSSGRAVTSIDMECDCSKGTYIRSLCRDIALELGSFGCVSHIRRTRIGMLPVTAAVAPDALVVEDLKTSPSVLAFPSVLLTEDQMAVIRNGGYVPWNLPIEIPEGLEKLVFALDENGVAQSLCTYEPGRILSKFFIGVGE